MHDNPIQTFFPVVGGNIAVSLMLSIAVRLAGIVGVLSILNLLAARALALAS